MQDPNHTTDEMKREPSLNRPNGTISAIRQWERDNGVALQDRIPSRADRRRFDRLARRKGGK